MSANKLLSIEEAIKGIDIVKELSSYIELKRSGANYLGKCPFHDDSTPSLSVSEQKQMWKCFGCGKGGDVVKFVSLYENISYMEALSKLAAKYNLPINLKTEEEEEKKDIYKVMNLVSNFYQEELTKNPKALNYVIKRGISSKSVEEFGIGYSPNHYKLGDFLSGISKHYIDLYKSTKNINEHGRDIFERRIVIPIRKASGVSSLVVGFGGRLIDDEQKNTPKYINSSDSFLFNKSKLLFGIDLALPYIKEKQEVILVEGYFDVVRIHQIGIKNVVAPLGTSFTQEQAKLLSKYAKIAYLMFDNDSAGKNASLRASVHLISNGLKVFLVGLEEAKDPDEFGLKFGKEGVLRLLKSSKDIIEEQLELNNVKIALELISSIEDPQDLIIYRQKLASKGIPKYMIENYIGKKKNKPKVDNDESLTLPMPDKILLKALKVCDIDVDPLDIEWLNKQSILIAEKIKSGKDLEDKELSMLHSVDFPEEKLKDYLSKAIERQKDLDKASLMSNKNTLSRISYFKKYYLTHGKM